VTDVDPVPMLTSPGHAEAAADLMESLAEGSRA
jgi:hypothetical protein